MFLSLLLTALIIQWILHGNKHALEIYQEMLDCVQNEVMAFNFLTWKELQLQKIPFLLVLPIGPPVPFRPKL